MIRKKLFITVLTMYFVFMVSSVTLGAPGASVLYTETDLGGGLWQYDYTFYNTSDAAESLYSVYFYFSQSTTFDWVTIPTGWDSVLNGFTPISVTQADTYSTDTVYDIAAGNNLGLFSFTLDYRAGNISYDAYLSTTSGNQIVSGTTALVPEPVSSTLFIVGGAALGFRQLKKRFMI
jgi:hypothetical protein